MKKSRRENCGYALITALIVTAVTAALVLGFISQVTTEQRISRNDTSYSGAFYAAEAGLEKLNSDLSKLFAASVFPSQDDIETIQSEDYRPDLEDMTFSEYSLTGGQSTNLNGAINASVTTITVDSTEYWPSTGFFMIDAEEFAYTGTTSTTFTGVSRGQTSSTAATHANDANVMRSQIVTLSEGDYSGLTAQIIPFSLSITAQSSVGTEARLTREVQAALIPVFQFGMFSDSALGFFAGPSFTFNGRIHTNSNLFLTAGAGATLTLSDKITAAADVIRTVMPNGQAGFSGTVNLKSGTSTTRNLASTEGSLTGGPGTSAWSGWTNLSLTTYNGYIKNGLTGANVLTLPFVADGYSTIELIKRPPSGEGTDSLMGQSRLANQASLRVFISDAASNLPGGTGYVLDNSLSGYTSTPFAEANPNDPDFLTAAGADETANSSLIGGYIYIEKQDEDAAWTDVTLEILNLGISTSDTNAILRFQKARWDALDSTNSTSATDYVPINMFDTQEGRFRNASDSLSTTTQIRKLGIMNIVELNVLKLKEWLAGTIGSTGAAAVNNSGYIFYFSDRRGNRDSSGNETGELGFEDIVNAADNQGDPNSSLDSGEDTNDNDTLEIYGANLPYSPYSASTDLYTTGVPVPVAQKAINLTSAINSSTTSIPVSSVTGLSAGYYRIENEIVNCTSVSATPMTCSRGQLSTTAAAHTPTASIDLAATVSSTSATSFTVSSDTNVTVPGYYRVESETVLCTSKSGNVLTCERGKLGTTAATHTAAVNALSASITSSGTSITLTASTGFPTTSAWYRIENETVLCTRSSNTLTCTSGRGQLSTTAAAHPEVAPTAISAAMTTTTGTSFTFTDTSSFTVPSYYRIDNETINCSSKTSTTMTCSRGQLSTTAATHLISAAIRTALSAAVTTTSTTTITFTSTTGITVPRYYKFDSEIVYCSSSTSTTMTCSRGQLGTTAATHSAGAALTEVVTIGLVNVLPVNVFTSERASKNRVHYFRHALRLVNGSSPNLPTPGFTAVAENIVYVLGNYNSAGNFTDAHSYAAVMGDAVTLLSPAWSTSGDDLSFQKPHTMTDRNATTGWYRMAIASGKGLTFTKPSGEADQFFGTDGGAHNFLRFLEDWTGVTGNYRGSIVSLYYARQAVGPFKCCTSVYSPPTRAFAFDTDFLVPSQLPPGTPRFRDINNLAFRQTILSDND